MYVSVKEDVFVKKSVPKPTCLNSKSVIKNSRCCMAVRRALFCPDGVLITMKLHYKKQSPRRTLQSVDNQNDTSCDLKA